MRHAAPPPEVLAFIGRVGGLFERGGQPGMAGRILAFLLAAPEPVQSSAAIARALHTSGGTVGIQTRALEQLGVIERIAVPGQRGVSFQVRPDAWDAMFRAKIADLRDFRAALDEVLAGLGEADPARVRRLREVREFYAFLEVELPALVNRWWARREEVLGGGR